VILGTKVVSPACIPIKIHVSMTRSFRRVTMSHEPLQSTHFTTILCNNIIVHPTLKSSFEGGNPNKSKKLKHSVKYNLLLSAPTSIMATSALRNVQTTLGKMSIMSLLMLSTISFQVDKLMRSLKYSLVCEFTSPIPLYTT